MDSVSPLWGICRFSDIESSLIECRAKSRLPENASSIIVACFPYLLPEEEYKNSNISKYAVVTDYHDVALSRLRKACDELSVAFPENKFVPFADNSPVPEVSAALYAGLGVRGKNTLLITEKYGSFVFIGEIVTDLVIDSDKPTVRNCTDCGRCSRECPAHAITENGIDSEKCISAITQKKGELTEEEKKLMKKCGCVWGCDVCQDVCPMNINAAFTQIEEFLQSAVPVLCEDTDISERAYAWRGRKVIDRNLSISGE